VGEDGQGSGLEEGGWSLNLIEIVSTGSAVITERVAGSIIALGGVFMSICGCLLVYRGANFSEKLPPTMIVALGFFVCRQGIRRALFASKLLARPSETLNSQSAEDRLDELERLKRRDMVTPEEYAAKRQEILKDL
jgi:hypothetical protein